MFCCGVAAARVVGGGGGGGFSVDFDFDLDFDFDFDFARALYSCLKLSDLAI